MSTNTRRIETVRRPGSLPRAPRIALLVATASAAVMAVIYLLIGTETLSVIEPVTDQPTFGYAAAAAFGVLAVVVYQSRRRLVWVAAALMQLFVAFVYFNLADQRTPHFEMWGITLRIIQIPLIAALVYLAIRDDRG
jgi:peptidoglycan/LPS O-acetylase OafA/YrhL